MASRTFVRALHSSRALLNANAAGGPAPAAGRAPPSAKDLGFSGERRKRVLPTLDIPKSARESFKAGGNNRGPRPPRQARDGQQQGQLGGPREPRQPREPRGDRQQQGDRQPRQAREPRGDRQQRDRPPRVEQDAAPAPAPAAVEAVEVSEGPLFERKAKLDAFDMPAEFFEGADLAPAVATSSRVRTQNQGQNQNRNQNRTQNRDGQNRDQRPRRERTGGAQGTRREQRPRQARGAAPVTPALADGGKSVVTRVSAVTFPQVTRDVSPRGLFGSTSILTPRPRTRDDPTSYFWAKDMDRATAYKSAVLASVGSYDMFLPPQPKEGKDPKANALANAVWTMGMNPTYSQPDAAKAVETLKKLL